MARCTAPVRGHSSAAAAAACPVCRYRSSSRYGGAYSSSYYPSTTSSSYSSSSGGSSSSGFELGEWRPSTLTFAARRFRCQASPSACLPLRPVTVVRQLLDVVHHAVELPLRIDFPASAQREAIEPFVVPEVAEHR